MTGKRNRARQIKPPQGSDPTSFSYPTGRPVAQGGLLPQVRPEAGWETGQEGSLRAFPAGLAQPRGLSPSRAVANFVHLKTAYFPLCYFGLRTTACGRLASPPDPALPAPWGPSGGSASSASSEPGWQSQAWRQVDSVWGPPMACSPDCLSFKKDFMVLTKGNTRQGSKSREGFGGQRGPSLGTLAPGLARWRNLDQVLPLWASLSLPSITHSVSWCV